MKLKLLIASICSALLLLAALPASTLAQDAKSRSADDLLANQRVKQFTTLLDLTDEQQKKIRPIVFEEFKSIRAVREDDSIALQDRFSKQDVIRQATKVKIKAELTPDQLVKWGQLEKGSKKPKNDADKNKK